MERQRRPRLAPRIRENLARKRQILDKFLPSFRAAICGLIELGDTEGALSLAASLRQIAGNTYPNLSDERGERARVRKLLQSMRKKLANAKIATGFDQLLSDF